MRRTATSKCDGFTENKEDIISKDEMNLAEFPFTLLSRRVISGQKTIEVSQQVYDKNRRVIKQEWIVTGSEKFGLPLAIDEDVYVALMQLYKKSNFKERRIFFSRYEILKIMGKKPSKREYDIIEQSLNRLVTVSVVSKNAFWDNKVKSYVGKAFHLFESYDLYDEKPGRKGVNQQALPLSNVVMSEFLFNSIKSGYIKNLDIRFYFSLETPLSKRLYRYLDKKKYHKSRFEVELLKLASLLPIQDNYPSQIKRRLSKSHDELIEKGFLKSVSYEDTGNGNEKVIYVFPQTSLIKEDMKFELEEQFGFELLASEKELKEDKMELSADELSALEQLVQRGITEATARNLAEIYSAEQIQKQVEVFDWLIGNKSSLVGKNPAGFLRKAIEEDYQPPKEYLEQKDKRDKEQKKEDRRERWRRYREELIRQNTNNWDKVSPERRIEGRLSFWIASETMKGRKPTLEQIEIKKQELIDGLPQTDEERWEYLSQNYPEDPPEDFE